MVLIQSICFVRHVTLSRLRGSRTCPHTERKACTLTQSLPVPSPPAPDRRSSAFPPRVFAIPGQFIETETRQRGLWDPGSLHFSECLGGSCTPWPVENFILLRGCYCNLTGLLPFLEGTDPFLPPGFPTSGSSLSLTFPFPEQHLRTPMPSPVSVLPLRMNKILPQVCS